MDNRKSTIINHVLFLGNNLTNLIAASCPDNEEREKAFACLADVIQNATESVRNAEKVRGRGIHLKSDTHIQCTSCKEVKPLIAFSSPLERTCRECKRNTHFMRTYGISQQDYNAMYDKQDGLCKICRTRAAVYVDHNHKSGKVRGLLCPQCNTALGWLFDNYEIIKRASDYVLKDGMDMPEPERPKVNFKVVEVDTLPNFIVDILKDVIGELGDKSKKGGEQK